jgi:hypothetical protein
MRKTFALLVLVLLSGCASSKSFDLDKKWEPLEEIRERPSVASNLAPDTVITTVGRYCYVKDLDKWLDRTKPGTAKFEAIMRHEQEHAFRQKKTGVFLWISRYGVDKKFALEEEQRGYYYEIIERRRLGDLVVPEAYANVLSNYKILTGRLISYNDALNWVRAVLNGQWVPPS